MKIKIIIILLIIPSYVVGKLIPKHYIIATINDDIITTNDLEKQKQIIKYNSKSLKLSPKMLTATAIRELIRLTLRQQYLKNQKISIPQYEIDKMIKQNDIKIPKNKNFTELYLQQIKTEISWNMLINSKISTIVRDDEIKNYINIMLSPESLYKYDTSIIYIDSKSKDKIKKIKQMFEKGASFSKVAKMYSSHPSAKKGGYIGSSVSLPYQINKELEKMKPGTMSKVLSNVDGYYIVFLHKKINEKKEISNFKISAAIINNNANEKDINQICEQKSNSQFVIQFLNNKKIKDIDIKIRNDLIISDIKKILSNKDYTYIVCKKDKIKINKQEVDIKQYLISNILASRARQKNLLITQELYNDVIIEINDKAIS